MKKRVLLLAGLLVIAIGVGASTEDHSPPDSPLALKAKALAVKMDRILDQMEEPEFVALDLQGAWEFEILPYLEYEGLTQAVNAPVVLFEPQPGTSHRHIAGWTYCKDSVVLNIRFINWTSPWYDDPSALMTAIHEIVHAQGGDFCSFISEVAESRTQLGTLEVAAALANDGNPVALYALLDELRGIAADTVLADYLSRNDLDGFREWRKTIFPGAAREAKFEKSMRFWSYQMSDLKGILDRYSVSVFRDFQDGQFKVDLPETQLKNVGDGFDDIVLLDDLMWVIDHAEDMANDPEGV